MTRVHVLVEGRTEQSFIGRVLRPHLAARGVFLSTKVVETKRLPSGRQFQGGIKSYGRLRRDLLRLLGDTDVALVTTMIDLYGLPPDFPGLGDPVPGPGLYPWVEHLEHCLLKDLAPHRHFFPYLSVHEFEALLLSSPRHLSEELEESRDLGGFESLLSSGRMPEEINDGPETHPAARIRVLAPQYRKAFHGPRLAERIGLRELRARCPHFGQWVTALENLATRGAGSRP